ncbi:NMCC_0638 family (lipo)protein [Muricoccus radiodurans]|uniref:NMCC_0638 family (lipo)protein n=1 Tax=Muricoccus radiodurans TaxID=2231721 RepID=UPI003CF1A9F1
MIRFLRFPIGPRAAARVQLLALAIALLAAPARAASPELTRETAGALGSFMQICARLMLGGDTAAAAATAGLVALPAAEATRVLHGARGRVFAARGSAIGTMVLLLPERPLGCSMRLERMDVAGAESLFTRLAESIARPGLSVTRAYDGTIPTPNARPSRQITYRLSTGVAGRPDFAMLFTGNDDPAVGTQGVLTFGTAAPRGQ